jgi:RHS repeat-associated protein
MVGQVKRSGSTWSRYYYLKDHLGNIRVTVNASGGVENADDYYPFGMQMEGRSLAGSADGRFKYNGKELDNETGLLHYGNRDHDPRIGRFVKVDQFAEKYPGLSPYSYAANNPMYFVDINGDSLITVDILNTQGYIHGQTRITIDHTYLADLTSILQAAVDNGVHIHINSSFRTIEVQNSDEIQQNGTTPAGDESRHVAGFAIDFNLYTDNNVSKSLLGQNHNENSENNRFIRSIGENGSRWGGDFRRRDPIHFDAGDNNGLSRRYGVDFNTARSENQTQYSTRGITRTENVNLQFPIRRLEPAPLNLRMLGIRN